MDETTTVVAPVLQVLLIVSEKSAIFVVQPKRKLPKNAILANGRIANGNETANATSANTASEEERNVIETPTVIASVIGVETGESSGTRTAIVLEVLTAPASATLIGMVFRVGAVMRRS